MYDGADLDDFHRLGAPRRSPSVPSRYAWHRTRNCWDRHTCLGRRPFLGERSCRERGSAPWIGASLGSRFGTFESLAVDRLAAAGCGNGITFGRCSVARLKHRLRRNCSFKRTRHFGSCDRCRTVSCGLRFDSRFRLLRLLVASPQSRTSRYICLREPGRRCLPRFGSSRRTTYGENDRRNGDHRRRRDAHYRRERRRMTARWRSSRYCPLSLPASHRTRRFARRVGRASGHVAILLNGIAIWARSLSTRTLETDKSENVRFYDRFGFTVRGQAEVIGVQNWFMQRKSASVS